MRNQLKQVVENYLASNNGIQYTDEDNQPNYDSIDLDALEKHASNVMNGKRNVAAMARLGLIRPGDAKRSIATLAKNGQLPSREPDTDDLTENQWNDFKRNIGSLARTGTISGKRNIGAARDFMGKRNLPSILRSGGGGSSSSTSSTHGPQHQPKRNVAALARDNLYPYYHQSKNEKRDVTAANNKRMFWLSSNFNLICLCLYLSFYHFGKSIHT